jgi:hypothetical protein
LIAAFIASDKEESVVKLKPLSIIVTVICLAIIASTIYHKRVCYRTELSAIIPQGRQIISEILLPAYGNKGRHTSIKNSEGPCADGYRFEAGYQGDDQAAIQKVLLEADRVKGMLGLKGGSSDGQTWSGSTPYSDMRTWHLRVTNSANEVMITLTWK